MALGCILHGRYIGICFDRHIDDSVKAMEREWRAGVTGPSSK